MCGADKCQKPTEKTLKWIQCEVCNNWLHMKCMGLKEQLDIDSFFACIQSWKPKTPITLNEELEEEEADFSGFLQEEMEKTELEIIIGRRTRKAAEKCRNKLIKKISNKEL